MSHSDTHVPQFKIKPSGNMLQPGCWQQLLVLPLRTWRTKGCLLCLKFGWHQQGYCWGKVGKDRRETKWEPGQHKTTIPELSLPNCLTNTYEKIFNNKKGRILPGLYLSMPPSNTNWTAFTFFSSSQAAFQYLWNTAIIQSSCRNMCFFINRRCLTVLQRFHTSWWFGSRK